MFKRINIICGHYGSGKTNLALNIALDLKASGETVTLVDLDIVNPYFRSADYSDILIKSGIKVISPATAGTTVDAPALTAEIYSIFGNTDGYVIMDVGGDDVGASALGRFSKLITAERDYQMLYVINKFRKLISTPEEALELLREIEGASRLKATGIVNNSHLSHMTTVQDILLSMDYAKETAELTSLPLVMTTAPKPVAVELAGKIENLYPVDVIVKLPWN